MSLRHGLKCTLPNKYLFTLKTGQLLANTLHLAIPGLVDNRISRHTMKLPILTAQQLSTIQYLSLTFRGEHRLRVFDNGILRRIYALQTYIINSEN
jgi:hypothetical protein